MKNSRSDQHQHQHQHRTLLAAAITTAVTIIVVIVGILIVTKGVGAALPSIFSGIVFTAILVLYWLRIEKDDVKGDDRGE